MFNGLEQIPSCRHYLSSYHRINNNYNGYSSMSFVDDQQSCSHRSSSGNIDQHQQPQPHPHHSLYSRHGYGQFTRHNTAASSLAAIGDSMSEIVIDDLQNENEPTSAILDYCKRKFLRPYVTILSIIGLHPITTDTTFVRSCLAYFQALIILIILCLGYFLQYLSSFRGDRGFTTDTRNTESLGELIFGYVIPSGLHLCGFMSAVVVFKSGDNEHLQNLVERVFLMATVPRRLCVILWLYMFAGLVLLTLFLSYVMLVAANQGNIIRNEMFGAMDDDVQYMAKIFLVGGVFAQHIVQVVIQLSYSIECLLLRVHLLALSEKLIQHTIENIDWMREVLEFRKLLNHLNNKISVPIGLFTVMNLSYAFSGLVFLFKDFDFHYFPAGIIILNISNVVLWLFLGLLPFFQAASLTRICSIARENGHHIRVRPFVYHNSSAEDLNSTLLFAASLNMSAKLFRMPIQVNYLCFAIVVISVTILTIGMCLNFELGSF